MAIIFSLVVEGWEAATAVSNRSSVKIKHGTPEYIPKNIKTVLNTKQSFSNGKFTIWKNKHETKKIICIGLCGKYALLWAPQGFLGWPFYSICRFFEPYYRGSNLKNYFAELSLSWGWARVPTPRTHTVHSNNAKTRYRKFETNIPKKGLRGLSPNFHIHVSVSDLYIPTIGPPILLQNRWTDRGNV